MESLVELDSRDSGGIRYRLLCHMGSRTLAISAVSENETRAIEIPSNLGNDAMLHPESYLSSEEVIYGGPDVL